MIRRALAVSLGTLSLSLGVASLAQGCGDSGDNGSQFVHFADGGDGNDQPVPNLDGSVPADLAACATAKAQATKIPVYMLMILDGSGSMDNDNKWAAVVPALDAIFDDLKSKADPAFGVGFLIFADKNDATITDRSAGPYNTTDVPIAFVDATQHNKLRARLDLTSPNLGTPTFEVLSGQYPVLEAFVPAAPLLPEGRKVLVLMTDGVPDPDMPAGQNEGPLSLKLASDEFAKVAPAGPVTTFAIGIGALTGQADYNPQFMGALAVAGGAPNQPCDPNEATDPAKMCHFQITPGGKSVAQLKQEFIDTVNKIRTKVLSCEFKLDKSGGTLDPNKVNVVYTSGQGQASVVPENGNDGWTYDNDQNPTKVILHGASCDTVKSDPGGKIDIVLGCKTIIR